MLSARYILRQFFPIQCKGIILIVWNFGRRCNAYKNFTVQFLLIIHFSSGREKEANNIVLYSDFAFILWFIIIILFLFIFFTLLSCCYDTSLMGRGRKISGRGKEITGNAYGVVKFLTGVFEIKMLVRQVVAFHFPKPIRYCDVYLFAFFCMCFFLFVCNEKYNYKIRSYNKRNRSPRKRRYLKTLHLYLNVTTVIFKSFRCMDGNYFVVKYLFFQ